MLQQELVVGFCSLNSIRQPDIPVHKNYNCSYFSRPVSVVTSCCQFKTFCNMNKANNSIHNPDVSVKINISDAGLVLFIVETMAEHRRDMKRNFPPVSGGIKTSSVEAPVIGNTTFKHAQGFINSKFATRFLFTCTKEERGSCKFTWLSSLN